DAEEVVLSVHNAGPTIPMEVRYTIFEPLTRADMGQDPRAAGSLGLGLYIVKQIAKVHGGEVEIASRADEGTRFKIRLPREVPIRGGGVSLLRGAHRFSLRCPAWLLLSRPRERPTSSPSFSPDH